MTLKAVSAGALFDEMRRARAKFPKNDGVFAALAEEVGELARALGGDGDVQAEALQVACVAMRLYEEGDATPADATVYLRLMDAAKRLENIAREALASLAVAA